MIITMIQLKTKKKGHHHSSSSYIPLFVCFPLFFIFIIMLLSFVFIYQILCIMRSILPFFFRLYEMGATSLETSSW